MFKGDVPISRLQGYRLSSSSVQAETRVRGSDLPPDHVPGGWSAPSCGRCWAFSFTYGELASGVPEGFLYDGQLRPVAWLDATGAVKATFVYGLHVNVPEYMTTSAGTYRILTDHLGSPRLVVDSSSGAVAQRMDYDGFGQVLNDTSPGFQPFGFAGGFWDRDTGLVRFGARDYDPSVGRWTNKDPIRFAGGLNPYENCAGDPINLVDPRGLFVDGGTGLGAGIAGGATGIGAGTMVTWAGGTGLAFGGGWLAGTWLNAYLEPHIQNMLDKVFGPPGGDLQAGRKSDLKQVDAITRGYPDLRDDFGEWLEDLKVHGERGSKNKRGDFTYKELQGLFEQFRQERGCGE